MTSAPGTGPIFMTLAAARAIECNGCGDCCDSRRTDGYWTWGSLPSDQFASMNDGEPLIIPLEQRDDGQWLERPRVELDGAELSPTRFRCAAFQPQEDGRGLCGHHDRTRPDRCGEFPVYEVHLESELQSQGEVALNTSAFPRCSWYGVIVVPEGDPRIALTEDGAGPG
jgi:Fe-S-cluster containining protein